MQNINETLECICVHGCMGGCVPLHVRILYPWIYSKCVFELTLVYHWYVFCFACISFTHGCLCLSNLTYKNDQYDRYVCFIVYIMDVCCCVYLWQYIVCMCAFHACARSEQSVSFPAAESTNHIPPSSLSSLPIHEFVCLQACDWFLMNNWRHYQSANVMATK